jgi:hypothetical protein
MRAGAGEGSAPPVGRPAVARHEPRDHAGDSAGGSPLQGLEQGRTRGLTGKNRGELGATPGQETAA